MCVTPLVEVRTSDGQAAAVIRGFVYVAAEVIRGIVRCFAISRGYALGVSEDGGGEAIPPSAYRKR
jgi:hypothetical protein